MVSAVTAGAAQITRDGAAANPDETGWRHFVMAPQHVLTDAERADLAAHGVQVQRALPGGRYLVRISPQSNVTAGDPRVRSLEALTGSRKVAPSAFRDEARGFSFAHLKVIFNDEVSLDQAKDAVIAAGGVFDDPFATEFEPLRSLTVRIPTPSLLTFADDERVMTVYGVRKMIARTMNAAAAAQSHVSDVQTAPYNLNGDGVALSYFELAPADTTHPEFQGRLSSHVVCPSDDKNCSDADNKTHATHTGGTMIAAGLNPAAKGMAPKATLNEYLGDAGNWLKTKDTGVTGVNSIADNNSWGYEFGWLADGSTGWTWEDGDELIGGYEGTVSAVIDHIALTNNTIFVHSAGNDGRNTGPVDANGQHNHADDSGTPTKDIYCYSRNGSGKDCPAPPTCSAGAQFCETQKHPVHNPFGSIGFFASMKNIISVGAVDSFSQIASFSSRGPAKDGRIKPEITAKGRSLFSTVPGSCPENPSGGCYESLQGTSMAAPVITGTMALLVQQWRNMTGDPAGPGPLALKGIVLATADDLGNPGPDYTYGFGFLNAKKAVDLMIADGGQRKRIVKDAAANGSQFDYPVTLSSQQDFRAFLSWMDPEVVPIGSDEVVATALVNDLDLKVVGPNGTTLPYVLDMNNPDTPATRGVNTVDNNEEVEIKGAQPGTYHIIVNGTRVTANSPQPFVVVTTADIGSAAPPCTDVTEPNDTPDTAFGDLVVNSPVSARICGQNDVDFFKFVTSAVGTASVKIASTDSPLTASLIIGGAPVVSVNIPAGTTQTLSVQIPSASVTQVLLKVQANGTLGADAGYTVTASYPFNIPPRRRATRH